MGYSLREREAKSVIKSRQGKCQSIGHEWSCLSDKNAVTGATKSDPCRLARPVNQVLTRAIRSRGLSVACEPQNLIHLATQGGRGLVHTFLSTTSHVTSFTYRASRQGSKFTNRVVRPGTAVKCNGWFGAARSSRPRLRHRGQRVGIACQKSAAVGLFAVDRETMTGELRCFSAGARRHQ